VWSIKGIILDEIEKRLEVLFNLGRYEEILVLAYENLHTAEVEQVLIYLYIIVAHLNRQEFQKALETCKEALGSYPQVDSFFYYKSKAHANMSAYKDALEDIQQALIIEPNSSAYLAQFAEILLIQNKFIEAKEQIEKALEIDPSESIYHLLLARILYMLDGKRVAREIVEDVLAKDPYNEEALYMKQEYFTSKLKEKKSILKNLLFLNPFDKKSQKDIRFIGFYYKYIPLLMGIVVFLSYLLQSNRHQFGFLEPIAFISMFVVGTIGSKDWRLNIPFIAIIVSFSAYYNLGSRGISFGEVFYIIFQALIFQLVFMGAFGLFRWLKYKLETSSQQQKNNNRNPIFFFLFISPFEKYEEVDKEAMHSYYTRIPVLLFLSLGLIYFYTYYFQDFYFKIALIVLFFVVATMSAKNIFFTFLYIFFILLMINKSVCENCFIILIETWYVASVFIMLYNFTRRFSWMRD
jgi:tetratricopeptide (TPR) repeat protein